MATVFEWLSLPQKERYYMIFIIITKDIAASTLQEKLEHHSCFSDFRPDFITLYMDQPDSAGHRYGPESDEVSNSLQH